MPGAKMLRLIVVCIAGVVAGGVWFAVRAYRVYVVEQRAIGALRALGHGVSEPSGWQALALLGSHGETSVTVHGEGAEAGWAWIGDLRRVDGIEFVGATVSGEWIGRLRRPDRLWSLSVRGGQIQEGVWGELHGLKGLEVVFLLDVAVADERLSDLAALPAMKMLYLVNNGISDAGLARLCAASKLEELHIARNPIRGSALGALSRVPNLRILRIMDCPLRGDEVGGVAAMRCLEHLTLAGAACGLEVLRAVSQNSSVWSIRLVGPGVEDDGVALFGRMQNLRELYLIGTSVSAKAIAALEATHPSLRVHVEPPGPAEAGRR